MKQNLLRTILLAVGVMLLIVVQEPTEVEIEKAASKSSGYMYDTMSDLQNYLVGQYSSGASSKYKGTAKVTTSYTSMGLVVDNIKQTTMNNRWNEDNINFPVDGTCGLVAETMLFRKYMTLASGKLPNSDTEYGVFSKLAEYAYDCGIFSKADHSGTNLSEQKKLANYYLDTYQKNKYTANTDVINLWATLKNYLDSKIQPVQLGLQDHSVVATACYVQKVSYKEKNILGNEVSKSKEFKVVRVCDGLSNTNAPESGMSRSKATHKFIFFDSVKDFLKLK